MPVQEALQTCRVSRYTKHRYNDQSHLDTSSAQIYGSMESKPWKPYDRATMEVLSFSLLRPSLPFPINSHQTKWSISSCVSSLPIISARILPTQSNRRREGMSSSILVRARGDMTMAPTSSTENFSSNVRDSKDVTVCEEYPENDKGVDDGISGPGTIDDSKMARVSDKLIEVFMVDKPTATDWRKLLAFSKEWSSIRPHFYKRCHEKANSESDPGMKHKLLRLSRKLKEIDDDVQRHNELLEAIKESPDEIGVIIAKRRKDFTKEFFIHLHTVAESYYDEPSKQNDLARLGNVCLAAVQAYDNASQSIEALNAAELKFNDIVSSPTVDAACRKIDALAEKKELDSALMLMITKAWSTAKESNMMKDEVKDVLYHLYKTAVGNLQRLMPKEIRILKYLLTIEDTEEQLSALKDAFTPGDELEGKNVDCLYTTPEALYTWIGTVVDAYHFSREGTLIKEARDLMNPKVIQRLEDLKRLVQNNFL